MSKEKGYVAIGMSQKDKARFDEGLKSKIADQIASNIPLGFAKKESLVEQPSFQESDKTSVEFNTPDNVQDALAEVKRLSSSHDNLDVIGKPIWNNVEVKNKKEELEKIDLTSEAPDNSKEALLEVKKLSSIHNNEEIKNK